MRYYREESVPSKWVTLFDDKGNSTEDINYGPDGSIGDRYVYRRDHKGNRIEAITYGHDGSIRAREVYANTYDGQGNLIEQIYDRWDNRRDFSSYHQKWVATYDEKGRMSESLLYEAEDSLWRRLKYALFGKWKYVLVNRGYYAYYANGYTSEVATHNSDGTIRSKSTYSYEFDVVGNWIKEVIQYQVPKNGKLETESTDITKRTITYYESPKDEKK